MQKRFLILGGIFLLSLYARISWHAKQQDRVVQLFHRPLTVTCVVKDYYCTEGKYSHRYALSANLITSGDKAHAIYKDIMLSLQEKLDCEVGDAIKIKNIIAQPTKSERQWFYFLRNNLLATVQTKTIDYELVNHPKYSCNRWITAKRNHVVEHLRKHLSPQAFSLATALFFGKQLGNYEHYQPIQQAFSAWGISHYLARSGLHVIFLLAFWRLLIALAPGSLIIKEIVALLVMIFYTLFSFASASFMRAGAMFCFQQVARIHAISHHGIYTALLTCACMLIYNPYDLFALDFQLSFILSFALLIFFNQASDRKNSCASSPA